jgi:ankyrin repeat protein
MPEYRISSLDLLELVRVKSGYNDMTLLHSAAKSGSVEVVDHLLRAGGNVKAVTKDGVTPLHAAAQSGSLVVVDRLLRAGADVKAVTKDGFTPLHAAVRSESLDVVDRLLRAGADAKAATKDDYTPLHAAAQSGSLDVVDRLLRAGADAKAATKDDYTPLHAAAQSGSLDVVDRLLRAGVDAKAVTKDDFTPLHGAAQSGSLDVVDRLLRAGADVKAVTKGGFTPLHGAAHIGSRQVADRLLELHLDPDHPGDVGMTPFHIAAQRGMLEVMKSCLRASGDPRLLDGFGSNVLDWSLTYAPAQQIMQTLLRNYQATSSRISSERLTATLQMVLRKRPSDEIRLDGLGRLLLRAGHDVDAVVPFERDILTVRQGRIAVHKGHCDICSNTVRGTRFVCRTCPDIDLCEKCYNEYERGASIRTCREHHFLRVPGSSWPGFEAPHVNGAGETFQEWLDRLRDEWNLRSGRN